MARVQGILGSRLTSELTTRELNFICRVFYINPTNKPSDVHIVNKFNENPNTLTNRASYKFSFEISNDVVNRLISIAKLECIDNNFFDWIDTNNNRLCNYIWSFIRVLKLKNLKNDFIISVEINKDDIIDYSESIAVLGQDIYKNFMLESLPKNNKIKKDCFIAFIDLLDLAPENKVELLNGIKLKWVRCSEKRDVINWVNKENQTWAWSYLYNNKNPVWFIDTSLSTFLQDGIITTFDLLDEVPDSRELLLKKMKLAWSQKIYRDKDDGKKSVNIVLKEDIIKKLDFICENTNRRKNEVVTKLILEEHDKIKKGGH